MMTCTVIAEAGVNHDGDVSKALKLCDAAKEAGADIVKFQTYIPSKSIRPGKDYDLVSRLALPFHAFYRISEHCKSIGIEFCSTPDDVDSLKFLVNYCKVKRIKIGSGSLTYLPLIIEARDTKLPVLVSTGMGVRIEIQSVIDLWENDVDYAGPFDTLILMHCVSLYPCPLELANVKAIDYMSRIWRKPIGYSDHTLGFTASIAAVALGAIAVEKHFTLNKTDTGPDHHMSMTPSEFAELVKRIREVETVLGTGFKYLSNEELKMLPRIRKDDEGYQPGV
jgi:N-acetylneuraminate synthase/N,N'-diacetyllegionaminate synthase